MIRGPPPESVVRGPQFPQYTLRVRKEANSLDAFNARMYRTSLDVPPPPPLGVDMAPGALTGDGRRTQLSIYDQKPIQSRGTDRSSYMQRPDLFPDQRRDGDAVTRAFHNNPYFDKFDPVTDPRNVIRELKQGIVENTVELDTVLSQRMLNRTMAPASTGDASTGTNVSSLQAYELLRPRNSTYEPFAALPVQRANPFNAAYAELRPESTYR
jgi:hypothetical protein